MDARLARGIELFNRREFFECHEAIEAVWLEATGARRFFLQAIIHIAVGFHHYRSGNRVGAGLQLGKGLRKLAGYLPLYEGMDTAALYEQTLAQLGRVERGEPVAYPAATLQSD